MNKKSPTIINERTHRFELTQNGATAYVDYEPRDNNTIELLHTEVPADLRGKGVGTRLIKESLELAESRNLQIISSCPFATGFIEKHPEYKRVLAHGEATGRE
jgi:predicted GNAT family acetyltransferase